MAGQNTFLPSIAYRVALEPTTQWQGYEGDHSPPSKFGATSPLTICLHGTVLNYITTGIFLPCMLLLLFVTELTKMLPSGEEMKC
jgi:hypothetical protein